MPIDSGDRTHLPTCDKCAWRGDVHASRDSARHQLDAHRVSVHDVAHSDTKAWRDTNRA